ncbi:MAG: hypothetical protein ACLFVO_26010 [Chloroflexaceae bacterium]
MEQRVRIWRSLLPAPEQESRLQPVPAAHRLKPGLLGRCPVYPGNQHGV